MVASNTDRRSASDKADIIVALRQSQDGIGRVISTAIMRELIDAGLSGEALFSAMKRIEDAHRVEDNGPSESARQSRNRRYHETRGRERRLKASDGVLRQTPAKASDGVLRQTLLARGEDNLLTLEVTGKKDNYTLQSARDFKSRSDLDWLSERLREAGGPALASMAIAPGMADMSPIIGLLSAGLGPPCDLEADVFPTVAARSAKQRPASIRSWLFFRDAIIEARDRRLAGAPERGEIIPIARGQGPPSLSERIGMEIAEAKRIALERLGAKNG